MEERWITEELYNELKEKGQLDPNTIYYIENK